MDCSSVFEEIVCRACAAQCHKGHTLIRSSNTLCRCLHKNPLINSIGLKSIETNVTENYPLISRPDNTLENETMDKKSSRHYLSSINKKYIYDKMRITTPI